MEVELRIQSLTTLTTEAPMPLPNHSTPNSKDLGR